MLSANDFPTLTKWLFNSSVIFVGSLIEALLIETQLGTLEADFEDSRVKARVRKISVTNSKKKVSSPGVLTGRKLLWIGLFFIQKQKMKRMNNFFHAQHDFK